MKKNRSKISAVTPINEKILQINCKGVNGQNFDYEININDTYKHLLGDVFYALVQHLSYYEREVLLSSLKSQEKRSFIFGQEPWPTWFVQKLKNRKIFISEFKSKVDEKKIIHCSYNRKNINEYLDDPEKQFGEHLKDCGVNLNYSQISKFHYGNRISIDLYNNIF